MGPEPTCRISRERRKKYGISSFLRGKWNTMEYGRIPRPSLQRQSLSILGRKCLRIYSESSESSGNTAANTQQTAHMLPNSGTRNHLFSSRLGLQQSPAAGPSRVRGAPKSAHKRWEYLHSDMHAAGYALDPEFMIDAQRQSRRCDADGPHVDRGKGWMLASTAGRT